MLIHLITIPVTNTSVNPARSTGPALFAGGPYLAQLWMFWVAPIVGAMVAGALAKWLYEPAGIVDTVVIEQRAVLTGHSEPPTCKGRRLSPFHRSRMLDQPRAE